MPDPSPAVPVSAGPDVGLSVILAAYRESENLSLLLPRLTAAVRDLTPTFEILVVDTLAPLDDTQDVCAAHRVRLLRRQPTNDYGDAIRTGIGASRGEFVIIMDADGSHNPDYVRALWDQRHRAEVVIASRYVAGGRTDNSPLLVGMSRLLNRVFRFTVGFPVLDVSNSFRLYRGELLRGLHLEYRHFDILEEILAKLMWGVSPPVRIIEIPYHFERRLAGESKRNLAVFGLHFSLAALRLYGLRRRLRADR
jgi:dolichol-phosphate mannosyltransferase